MTLSGNGSRKLWLLYSAETWPIASLMIGRLQASCADFTVYLWSLDEFDDIVASGDAVIAVFGDKPDKWLRRNF